MSRNRITAAGLRAARRSPLPIRAGSPAPSSVSSGSVRRRRRPSSDRVALAGPGNRSGSTAGSFSRPGSQRRERHDAALALAARLGGVDEDPKDHVLSEERPSKRSRPLSTPSHVSPTTSSATARDGTKIRATAKHRRVPSRTTCASKARLVARAQARQQRLLGRGRRALRPVFCIGQVRPGEPTRGGKRESGQGLCALNSVSTRTGRPPRKWGRAGSCPSALRAGCGRGSPLSPAGATRPRPARARTPPSASSPSDTSVRKPRSSCTVTPIGRRSRDVLERHGHHLLSLGRADRRRLRIRERHARHCLVVRAASCRRECSRLRHDPDTCPCT